jgi:quercetin dioxygenase-like cupin family protein
MATDAEAAGGEDGGIPPDPLADEGGEPTPFWVEVWNDYDPSMRFVAIFPLTLEETPPASTAAYYIIEPGKHTGLHSDNAEEVVFVAEGEGEVFSVGQTRRLGAGNFLVFPPGIDHDVYARGTDALRLLSFFPVPEVLSTFQQMILPVGGNILSSRPPQPTVTELDPNNLPADFPFALEDLGLVESESNEPRELTMTERLLGMTEPGQPIPPIGPENVIDPKTATGPIEINPPAAVEPPEDEAE